jgi:hypothetical protein
MGKLSKNNNNKSDENDVELLNDNDFNDEWQQFMESGNNSRSINEILNFLICKVSLYWTFH